MRFNKLLLAFILVFAKLQAQVCIVNNKPNSTNFVSTLKSPSTSVSAFNTLFGSYKVGAFISYAMTTYTASDNYQTNRNIATPAKNTYAPPSNIEALAAAWVDSLHATGKIDYYIMVTAHQLGFTLWDSNAELPTQTITDPYRGATITLPQIADYGSDGTYDVIGAVVNRCRYYNKPVYLYYNLGRKINYRGGNYYGENGTYATFCTKQIKELIDRYQPDGFWFDGIEEGFMWQTSKIGSPLHILYSNIKRWLPTCNVILNNSQVDVSVHSYYQGSNLYYWPGDVFSLETEFRTVSPASEYDYTVAKTNNGINYYINSESTTANNPEVYWFGAENKGATWYNQSVIQGYYDYARTNAISYVLNFSPSQSGIINAPQLQLLKGLNNY